MARIVGIAGPGASVIVGQMSSAAAAGTRTAAGVLQRADVSAEVVLGARDWRERPCVFHGDGLAVALAGSIYNGAELGGCSDAERIARLYRRAGFAGRVMSEPGWD